MSEKVKEPNTFNVDLQMELNIKKTDTVWSVPPPSCFNRWILIFSFYILHHNTNNLIWDILII